MKLFAVCARVGDEYETMYVHANDSVQARWVAFQGQAMPHKVKVYDLSQTALCAGVLDITKVPCDRFIA